MGKAHQLKIVIVVLLMMINAGAAYGYAADRKDAEWPFRVKTELAPDAPMAKPPYPSWDERRYLFSGKDDDLLILRDPGDRKNGAQGTNGNTPFFRLSLSRMVVDQRGRDVLRPENGGDDTLTKIRTLPSLLGNSSARETFGTIGEIFKPQVNLEINF